MSLAEASPCSTATEVAVTVKFWMPTTLANSADILRVALTVID